MRPPELAKKYVIAGAPSYEEGPFAWMQSGKYYLLYSRCGAHCSDSLDYAVGDSIQGPYTYRGTIVAHGKQGNEHGSVSEPPFHVTRENSRLPGTDWTTRESRIVSGDAWK